MKPNVPHSPFAMRLSGSAKETELRIRNIFQWKKKRPPIIAFVAAILVVALCGSLVGFHTTALKEPPAENNNSHQIAPLKGDALSPNGKYEVHLSGSTEGLPISSGGLTPPESVQIIDVQTGEILWECDGLYEHAALWSPDSSYLALACTARTYCTVTLIETNTWTDWNVTLPDGSAIPEYTFLPDEGWGEWLVEHNFLLTVGRGGEDGQTVYRCVPDPQDGGLTGIMELLAAEAPVNDPSVVLTAMASVKAEDFTNPDPNFWGLCVTAEQLAAALNAAVPNQISEEEFFSYGCDSTQIFPHWYIEHAFLESNPTGVNSKDRHFSIRCGLPENIVEVSLSEDNHRDTAYFEDRALYWLIREKDAFEDRMTSRDPVAYEQFKDLLIDQMERTLARMSDNPGNFTGYQLKRFTIAWAYEDKRDGGQVELYNFSFGLLTDTPETIGWAGGMALDSKLRVVNVGEPKYFAVKYLNEQVVSTAFMASDYELRQTNQDKEHISNVLDQAEAQMTTSSVSQSLPADARQSVLDYLRQEYLHAPVYYLGKEPSAPQEGDWRIDRVTYQGETPLYETIGRAYNLSFSTYSSSRWNQNSTRCLVLSFSIDGTLNAIEGVSHVTTESMPAETIILQVVNNLMDLEVSLWRDGYAWPAGPGNRVQFHREVYDGPETVEILENWEPIYSEGDYWAMHSWSGFEALCYHHADTGTYNINRIDTTRTDLFTHRGIRVGNSRADVTAAYPELKSGDYWGQYPGEDILWYCADPNDFGAALIFFFEGNTVSRIVLNNMFN